MGPVTMSWAIVMMAMLTGNPSNELLNFVDTAAYWQAKGVTVTVENMAKEVAPTDKPADGAMSARRLMAIRTLGELKDAKATETLNGVAKSQTPFEAEYAARALAEIRGETYTRVAPAADELAKDIMLLPKGCGVVAHVRLAGGPRMSLKEALDKLPAEMAGNKEEVGKAFTEMLTKFAEQAGNMRVEAVTLGVSGTAGDPVEVSVCNSGPAIPEHEQARLFERFYRGSEAHRVPGTGIGLAIVRQIAEAHGGTLSVASTAAAGTAFRLSLPREGVRR